VKRVALLLLAACSDFDPPSALTRPQVLAVRATPAAIAPGERAKLDALVAGPDGVLAPVLAWRVDAGPAALDGDWLVAQEPGDVALALDAGGLAAEKVVAVGERRDNPELGPVTADGAAIGAELRVPRGATVALAASAPSIRWYATIGAIDLHRLAATELVAPAEPGRGTLVVVARDDRGGVTWQIASIFVD
jgi:hypothetical protein